MTEQEAKLILDVRISRFDHAEDVNEALEIAKQALEEIQRYRGIGTVEEIKTVKKYIELKKRCGTPSNTIDLCAEYAAIGTVEECREAVEKQQKHGTEGQVNRMSDLKITKCTGEGQGSCKRCNDYGIWNRHWMSMLYKIEGYEGCYCSECVKEIKAGKQNE